jgi:hypothetical protein
MSLALAEVLAAHRNNHGRETLRKNLGDAHLNGTNAVFRTIRKLARKSGYVFRDDDSRYAGATLLSLDRILREKSIPYFDNVAGLVELESARPGFFRVRDLQHLGPWRNPVFHESTHALCHEVLELGDAGTLKERGSEALLRIILAESVVMATEHLAAAQVPNDAMSRYLFGRNFYVESPRGGDVAVRTLLRRYGPTRGHALLSLAMLFTWSYVEQPARRELESMLEHAGIESSPSARNDAARAYRRFFAPRGPCSRTVLMDFYLLSRGFSRTLGESGYLDFTDALRRHPHIVKRLARVSELVTSGLS